MSNPEILELLPTDDEPALLESVSTLRNPDMTKTRLLFLSVNDPFYIYFLIG